MQLWVSKLPLSCNNTKLRELFGTYGALSECYVVYRGRKSRGFGYATFKNQNDAEKAMSELNGSKVGRKTIEVVTLPLPLFPLFPLLPLLPLSIICRLHSQVKVAEDRSAGTKKSGVVKETEKSVYLSVDRSVYVGHLPIKVDETKLSEAMTAFGEIEGCYVVYKNRYSYCIVLSHHALKCCCVASDQEE